MIITNSQEYITSRSDFNFTIRPSTKSEKKLASQPSPLPRRHLLLAIAATTARERRRGMGRHAAASGRRGAPPSPVRRRFWRSRYRAQPPPPPPLGGRRGMGSRADALRREIRPCLVLINFAKFFRFPSHQIFRHMHEVLNIDENKN